MLQYRRQYFSVPSFLPFRELNVEDPHFKEGHAFVGFQKDTPAAVVFQATNQLEKLISQVNPDESPTWLRMQQIGILKDISASNLKLDMKKSSKIWRTAVSSFNFDACLPVYQINSLYNFNLFRS